MKSTILNLKNCKAVSTEIITDSILKTLVDHISTHFSGIFNVCIETGKFPDNFNESIIVPMLNQEN